jgi:hypothetical protein
MPSNLVPHRYGPGAVGTIRLNFNPYNRRGKQSLKVFVTSNDPARPRICLELHAEVRPRISAEPTFANLGRVHKGQGSTRVVTITSRNKALVPIHATPSVPSLTATVGQAKEVKVEGEAFWKTPLYISMAPTAPVGPVCGQITVRTSDPGRDLVISAFALVLRDGEPKAPEAF